LPTRAGFFRSVAVPVKCIHGYFRDVADFVNASRTLPQRAGLCRRMPDFVSAIPDDINDFPEESLK